MLENVATLLAPESPPFMAFSCEKIEFNAIWSKHVMFDSSLESSPIRRLIDGDAGKRELIGSFKNLEFGHDVYFGN